MAQKRDFKGVWISREIWLSKDLTLQEKVFLVEIDSLDNDARGCFAGNQYFADFFQLSERQCSRVISSLESKKMISVLVDTSPGKAIRKISSLVAATSRQKWRVGVDKNGEWPVDKNGVHNNTEENNTTSITAKPENGQAKKLITLFQAVRPSYEQLFKRRHEWAAAHRLLAKVPFEELEKIIALLPKTNGMPYAPVITSPSEMEEKLEKLRAFSIRSGKESSKIKVAFVK